MFNKQDYRMRRENKIEVKDHKGKVVDLAPSPLRGQGDYLKLDRLAKWTEQDFKDGKCIKDDIGKDRISGVNMQMTKKGLVAINRKDSRRKFRAPNYNSPNPNKNGYNIKLTKDPTLTNKQRLHKQRASKNAQLTTGQL